MKKKTLIIGICILGISLVILIGLIIGLKIVKDKNNAEYWNELTQKEDEEKEDKDEEEDEPETEVIQSENTEADALLQEALDLAMAEEDADPAAALVLLEQAAELGNADALYFSGEMYLQGI